MKLRKQKTEKIHEEILLDRVFCVRTHLPSEKTVFYSLVEPYFDITSSSFDSPGVIILNAAKIEDVDMSWRARSYVPDVYDQPI